MGHGSVNANNTIRYVPASDFLGTDSFIYMAVDSDGAKHKAEVAVHVGEQAANVITDDFNDQEGVLNTGWTGLTFRSFIRRLAEHLPGIQ